MTNNVLPAQIITPWANNATEVSVPDASLAGGSSNIAITDDITVESVQVQLTLEHFRVYLIWQSSLFPHQALAPYCKHHVTALLVSLLIQTLRVTKTN